MAEEELDPSLHTGVGNPLSPYNGELLSEEDEKRLDEKGQLVVRGLTWGEAATDVYLVVALHEFEEATTVEPLRGKINIDLSDISTKKCSLLLATSTGKPTFTHPTIGACLELPSDLASDDIKRQYVVEWLVNTVDESLKKYGAYVMKSDVQKFSQALAEAAESAIKRVF